MERKNVGYEMVGALRQGDLLSWWKKNSPDTKSSYPWDLVCEYPDKKPDEMSGQIEAIGLSGSGKTEFLNFASRSLDQNKIIIRPELVIATPEGTTENWGEGENSRKMRGLMAVEFGIKHQMLIWDQIKFISHLQGDVEQVQTGKELLIERGTNDILCTDSFTRPEHYSIRYNRYFQNQWLELIVTSIALAQRVDAVILFGTNYEETQKRRIAAGLEPEGKYINRVNWPEIMGGYEWWLGAFYPLFRKAQGMGLLILDGTSDLDLNNQKALNFSKKVFEARIGGSF